jgi:membrane protein involved in colicin uptake
MPFDFELSMQLREERARLLDEQTRRITAEQQAQAEQAARLAAEQRLAALEDELRRLRGSD